ncbi:hypothetical protein FQR65_LT16303 [Abscondita terminalis]|nr:hypothetical protein FQR65_LT16303 [Abscondita terminalis]
MALFEEKFPEIERYLEDNASAEPDILKRLRKETFQKTTQPHMISGYLQGRFLSILSHMLNQRCFGNRTFSRQYANIELWLKMAEDGKIYTLDKNEDLAYLPQKYFDESEYNAQIEFILGDAKEEIKKLDVTFDLSRVMESGKMLLSMGSEVSFETIHAQRGTTLRQSIVETAKEFLNVPYLWGGKSFFGVDCSGFTQLVLKVHDIKYPVMPTAGENCEMHAKSEKEQQEILLNYRLAFRAETTVNWCPGLGTVLANDEVINGLPTPLKDAQEYWIGKSQGAEVNFGLENSDERYAINPFTGKKMAVYISDYVLMGYGTGAVMAVPAHDERDHRFAKKFGLEITEVVEGGENVQEEPFIAKDGICINSDFLNGLKYEEAKAKAITEVLGRSLGNAYNQLPAERCYISPSEILGRTSNPYIYKDDVPLYCCLLLHTLELPEVGKNTLPTEDGDPPLGKR